MFQNNLQDFSRRDRSYSHEQRYKTYRNYLLKNKKIKYDKDLTYLTDNCDDLLEGSFELGDDELLKILDNLYIGNSVLKKTPKFLIEYYSSKNPEYQAAILRYYHTIGYYPESSKDASFEINLFRYMREVNEISHSERRKHIESLFADNNDPRSQNFIAREICFFILKSTTFDEVSHYITEMTRCSEKNSSILHGLKSTLVSFSGHNLNPQTETLMINILKETNVIDNSELFKILRDMPFNHTAFLRINFEKCHTQTPDEKLDQQNVFDVFYKYMTLFLQEPVWNRVYIYDVVYFLLKFVLKLPKTPQWKVEWKHDQKDLLKRFQCFQYQELSDVDISDLIQSYLTSCKMAKINMRQTEELTVKIFIYALLFDEWIYPILSYTVLEAFIKYSDDKKGLLKALTIFGIYNHIICNDFEMDEDERPEENTLVNNYYLRCEILKLYTSTEK